MYNENYDKLNELLTMRLDEAISKRTDFDDYNCEPYLEAMKIKEVINNIDKQETELRKTQMDIHCRENSDNIKAKIEEERLEIEKEKIQMDIRCRENSDDIKMKIEEKRLEVEKEKTEMDIRCRENSDNIKEKIEKDRLTIERDRLNADVQNSCIEHNIEKSKNNSQTALRVLEIAAAVVVAPIVEHKFRKGFAKMICEFEKDYNFTTTAGRSLSKLFKL